jgi:hypothetical protein
MEPLELITPSDATKLSQNLTRIAEKINEIVEKVTIQESLISLLSINSPKIYPQIDLDYRDNIISIRASSSIQSCSGIIYVLPNETLEGSEISPSLEIEYGGDAPLIFSIKKEKPEGGLTYAEAGDIVANRLALFRINPTDRSEIILINPTINSGAVLTDVTLQNVVFIVDEDNPLIVRNAEGETPLVTEDDLDELRDEFLAGYQQKVIVSTDTLEIYNQSHTLEDGQIFIQIEAEE